MGGLDQVVKDLKSIPEKVFKEVRSLCKGDETCILLILLCAGFLLCRLMSSDGFSSVASMGDDVDASLKEAVDAGEKAFGFGKAVPHTTAGQIGEVPANVQGKTMGLEPKPHRAKKMPPSMGAQMEIQGPVKGSTWNSEPQKGGLLAQDGTIAAPFNEVWTPGYESVDLAFKGALPLDNTKPPTDSEGSGTSGHLGGEGVNLTLYYAPWCGHCKAMMPAFDEFQKKHHGTSIGSKILNIFKVNSEEEPDKVKAAGVTGFPHVSANGTTLKGFPRDDPSKMIDHVQSTFS